MTFLGNNRIAVMENIAEYPLLFVDDYNDNQNAIIDVINNHETSLSLQDDGGDGAVGEEEEDGEGVEPRAKRRKIEDGSLEWKREGIG